MNTKKKGGWGNSYDICYDFCCFEANDFQKFRANQLVKKEIGLITLKDNDHFYLEEGEMTVFGFRYQKIFYIEDILLKKAV